MSRGHLTEEAIAFLDYWSGLPKRDGILPDRQDFDPVDIAKLMPMTVMIEGSSPEDMRFRLFGTGIQALTGFDLTGERYMDYQAADARHSFTSAMALQLDPPCGRASDLTVRAQNGQTTFLQTLVLPMAFEKKGVPLLLGHVSILDRGDFGDGAFEVLSLANSRWIDLGGGVPEGTP